MASYRKYKGRWTVTIRIPEDYPHPTAGKSISETFVQKERARDWANRTADAIKLGLWRDPRLTDAKRHEDLPLRKALERYRDVSKRKKSAEQEEYRISAWLKHPLADKPLSQIRAPDIAAYRDERLDAGKAASTIRNEVNLISHLYEVAIADWGYEGLVNPVKALRARKGAMPKLPPGRERRLKPAEEKALREAMADDPEMLAIFEIAIETGMRRGEILELRRSWRDGDVISIPDSKSGEPRSVILSKTACDTLDALPARLDGKLFGYSEYRQEWKWTKARTAAKVKDFHFHDLRHEALSRMSARGANIKVMMRQSGHKTPSMLMRYLNPTADEVRQALYGDK